MYQIPHDLKLARCISEFDSEVNTGGNGEESLHHEEGLAAQLRFKKQVQNLIDTINDFGNRFEDNCPELLVLNT